MARVWRLKTKPNNCDDAIRRSLISAMLREGFIATGWAVDTIPATAAEYGNLADSRYGPEAVYGVKRFVTKPEPSDLIWIADLSGLYHLAKVAAPWIYQTDDRDFGAHAVNRYPCEWITSGRSAADTPSGVRNALMRGSVFCQIHDSAAVMFSYKLAGRSPWVEAASVLELLGHDALEDLVGLYLQIKTNSVIVPSSCKQSTTAYEFVLKPRDGSGDIVAQVKSGTEEITDCLPEVGCKRYLFAISGEYPENPQGAQIISRDELEAFMQTHRVVLPQTIQCWLDST